MQNKHNIPPQLYTLIGIASMALVIILMPLLTHAQSPEVRRIGFYGEASHPAAAALRLAIEQIDSEGGFPGADGGTYLFEPLISSDPNDFTAEDVLAVLTVPADESGAAPAESVLWDAPAIVLDSDMALQLPGVQAAVYRGMTPRSQLDNMLVDFLLTQSQVRRVMLIGQDAALLNTAAKITAQGGIEIQQRPDPLLTTADFQALLAYNPQTIFFWGDPQSANTLMQSLDQNGWQGFLVVNDVRAMLRLPSYAPPIGIDIISVTHWDASAADALSQAFSDSYRQQNEANPDARAVAAYDIAWALRLMVERHGASAGDILLNLPISEVIRTTGGTMDPRSYGGIDLYRAGMIVRYRSFSDRSVLARYDRGVIVPEQSQIAVLPTATPFPTATPSQFTLQVTRSTLNVRQGPSSDYAVIGQLSEGEQVVILGILRGGGWYLVQSLWGPGWVIADAGTVFDPQNGTSPPALDSPPPPTPTPLPTVPTQAAITVQVSPTPDGTQVAAGIPNTGNFALGGQILNYSAVPLMQSSGMSWVKEQVRWERGETADKAARGAIEAARANNMRIVIGSVGWNYEMAGAPSLDAYFAEFAEYLRGVAALGPDAIEVWNEPNIDREWVAGQIDGATYTRLLEQAYRAIKETNPNVIVISGAPAPTGFFGGQCTPQGCDDAIFLQQMASAGAANFLDCVGVHYNEGVVAPDQRSGDPRGEHYSYYLPEMIDLYSGIFGGARPLCFTEFGYLSAEGFGTLAPAFGWASGITVNQQADYLARAVRVMRQSGRVQLAIVWNVNFQSFGEDPRGGYAIIRPGGNCVACPLLLQAMQ